MSLMLADAAMKSTSVVSRDAERKAAVHAKAASFRTPMSELRAKQPLAVSDVRLDKCVR